MEENKKREKTQLQIAKDTLRSIVNEYRKCEEYLKASIKQSLTSNYQVVVAHGFNDGQAVLNQVAIRGEKEQFIKSVEDILRVLPSTFRKIIINRYFRKLAHKEIIAKMDIDDDFYIAERTYYDWHDRAVMAFYNEAVARTLEIKSSCSNCCSN